jgi:hypothetical protein
MGSELDDASSNPCRRESAALQAAPGRSPAKYGHADQSRSARLGAAAPRPQGVMSPR